MEPLINDSSNINKSDINIENNIINNNNNSQEINTYSDQCNLLNMISIPSFGIYSNDYAFLEQILILKKNSIPNNIPLKVKEQINYLNNKYPELKPEFFHITLSSSILFTFSPENINPTSFTALNFISHPYIFYNCELNNKEHKSDIYCAAYIDDNQENDAIKEEGGNTHLRVNPNCNIDDDQLKREVYIHLSGDGYPSLSPNNCHLLINLNSQIINFYVITCGTYYGKIVKCFIGNYIIIPNVNNSTLFNELYKHLLLEKNKENLIMDLFLFRNKYNDFLKYILYYYINEIIKNAKNIDNIKNYIIKAFNIIFDLNIQDNKEENLKVINNISNYYYNNIISYINNLYNNSNKISSNFGEEILENNFKNNYIEELLIKYIHYNLNRVNNIILNMSYFILDNEEILFYLQNKSNEKYNSDILPKIKSLISDKLNIKNDNKLEEIKNIYIDENRIHKSNPNIAILINLCESIKNKENINLDNLDNIIKTYLFYIVWERKGKICGVHDDFGRISFMRINEIDSKYFCSDEERIECCQELIQYLINVDSEKNF